MIYATGFKNKINGNFKMKSPHYPYKQTVYIGYTEKQMKKQYRKDNQLKNKHIEWIIV